MDNGEMPHEIFAWAGDVGPMTGHWSANQHPEQAEAYIRKSDVKALIEAGRHMLNHAKWREENENVFWEASDLMRAALAAFTTTPRRTPAISMTAVTKAAQDAREVFDGHRRAKEAVDYMEQLLLAALADLEGAK